MAWLLEHWEELAAAAGLLMTAASIIAGLTPTPKDDEIVKKIIDFLSFLKPKTSQGTFKMPFTRSK